MQENQIVMARRHVLGELYGRCVSIDDDIPVYMAGDDHELLGHVNESLGHYRDAFSFFLGGDICRKLAAGHYAYTFDYAPIDSVRPNGRLKLTSITLVGRSGYTKIPRRSAAA